LGTWLSIAAMFADKRGAVAIYGLLISVEQAMASSIEVLEAEALQLSAADRARLVERLIASLDIDPAIEEAWAAEVERRNAEIESGAVSLIPGPEALAELKAQFR
jgi:putative addiction module component (TIGR02574 family)